MTLRELLSQLEEIQSYALNTLVTIDDIHVMVRGIDGVKRPLGDVYSMVATKRTIVFDTEQ
jgi:hypothetical protein